MMFYCTSCLANICRQNLKVGHQLRISPITNSTIKDSITGKRLFSQFEWSRRPLNSIVSRGAYVNRYCYRNNQYRLFSGVKFDRRFGLWLGLTTGLGVGGFLYGYKFNNQSLIHNETAMITTSENMKLKMKDDGQQVNVAEISKEESRRRRRRIVYKQMCLGSILGIGFGLVMIKISSVLIYLTVFSILTLEWLRNRGIIDFKGNKLIQLGTTQSKSMVKRIKIQEMNMFKITFLSTLLLTYFNY